jgi:hypothetical protein
MTLCIPDALCHDDLISDTRDYNKRIDTLVGSRAITPEASLDEGQERDQPLNDPPPPEASPDRGLVDDVRH